MGGRNEEIELMGFEPKNDQQKRRVGFCQDAWVFETLWFLCLGSGLSTRGEDASCQCCVLPATWLHLLTVATPEMKHLMQNPSPAVLLFFF